MSARRTLAVVSAGLGQPSSTRLLADRLADATARALGERGVEADVRVVELRDHAHALTDAMLTGVATPALRDALDAVTGADGLVAVTPVFTASYSGLFKVFADVLDPDALSGMPVLVGATAGTPRHSLVLEHAIRPLLAYLRAVVVPTAVFAAAEDWGTAGETGTPDGGLAARVERAAAELADLVAAREPRRRPDVFADVTPFEQLLAGGS